MNSGSGSYKEIIMIKRRSTRRGFTLPEVLVTVAIVSILAAVVVPAVTQQLSKADAPSLAASIGSLRTGMTAFVTDIRKFPRRVSFLANPITATDSTLDLGESFSSSGVAKWRGPYVSFAMKRGDSVPLGMSLFARDSMWKASNMMTVGIGGVTDTMELHRIDSLVDNLSGSAAGSLRWTGSPATSVTYLLMGSR